MPGIQGLFISDRDAFDIGLTEAAEREQFDDRSGLVIRQVAIFEHHIDGYIVNINDPSEPESSFATSPTTRRSDRRSKCSNKVCITRTHQRSGRRIGSDVSFDCCTPQLPRNPGDLRDLVSSSQAQLHRNARLQDTGDY